MGSAGLENISEDDLLIQIKTLAVKGKNKSVHRKEFYAMNQAPGQPIQAFVTKLKGKAMNCNYSIKCNSAACGHQVNSYAEHMIADQMVIGCANTDIQQEVLAKDSQLPDFQSRFDLIQALEEGKVAKSQLSSDTTSTLAHSQYQRQKNQGIKSEVHMKPNQPFRQRCSGCGSSEHDLGTIQPGQKIAQHGKKYVTFATYRDIYPKYVEANEQAQINILVLHRRRVHIILIRLLLTQMIRPASLHLTLTTLKSKARLLPKPSYSVTKRHGEVEASQCKEPVSTKKSSFHT